MQKYNKFVVALIGVVLTGLSISYGQNQTVQLVISIATALGVYTIPNTRV